jgi:hypothetical protein
MADNLFTQDGLERRVKRGPNSEAMPSAPGVVILRS